MGYKTQDRANNRDSVRIRSVVCEDNTGSSERIQSVVYEDTLRVTREKYQLKISDIKIIQQLLLYAKCKNKFLLLKLFSGDTRSCVNNKEINFKNKHKVHFIIIYPRTNIVNDFKKVKT